MAEGEGFPHDRRKLMDEHQNGGIGQQPAEVFVAGLGLVYRVVGLAAVEGVHQIGSYKHHQGTGGSMDAVGDGEHVDDKACGEADEVL